MDTGKEKYNFWKLFIPVSAILTPFIALYVWAWVWAIWDPLNPNPDLMSSRLPLPIILTLVLFPGIGIVWITHLDVTGQLGDDADNEPSIDERKTNG